MTNQMFCGKEIYDNFNGSGSILSKNTEKWFEGLLLELFPNDIISDKFTYDYNILNIRFFEIRINLEKKTISIPTDITFETLSIIAKHPLI